MQAITAAYNTHTKTITRGPNNPYVDSHLGDLSDKRHRLIHRWKRDKTDRALKRTIQALSEEA